MEKYIVQPEDSLIGISLKHNINLYSLLRMNSLSEDSLVYPGMQIRVREGREEEKNEFLMQKNVNYCCAEGTVLGKLTVFPLFLKFEPVSVNGMCEARISNEVKRFQCSRFESIINLKDIFEADLLENAGFNTREQIYLVQILLYTTGHEARAEVPIARTYFKVDYRQVYSKISDLHKKNKELLDSSMEIVNKINELLPSIGESSEFLTKIPIPEYLPHYLSKSEDDLSLSTPIEKSSFVIQSELIDPAQSQEIGTFLPDIQKFSSCRLLYSSDKNGFSLRTLFHLTENKGPCLLLIKDSEKCVFGAFLSPFLQVSNGFYGDGNTFVFTFKYKKNIECYINKGNQNKFFCTNFEGIIIGYG